MYVNNKVLWSEQGVILSKKTTSDVNTKVSFLRGGVGDQRTMWALNSNYTIWWFFTEIFFHIFQSTVCPKRGMDLLEWVHLCKKKRKMYAPKSRKMTSTYLGLGEDWDIHMWTQLYGYRHTGGFWWPPWTLIWCPLAPYWSIESGRMVPIKPCFTPFPHICAAEMGLASHPVFLFSSSHLRVTWA